MGDLTCDIAIVGASFAGLSAARRLMQTDPKLSVVVLDAGRVAESSAGRNSGFMIDLPHDLTCSDYAGSADYTGGLFTPGTAVIQPAAYNRPNEDKV